jgi:hypothetical protein
MTSGCTKVLLQGPEADWKSSPAQKVGGREYRYKEETGKLANGKRKHTSKERGYEDK